MKKAILTALVALIATSCKKSTIDVFVKKYEYTCTFWDYANGKMNLASKQDYKENITADSMQNWWMAQNKYDSVSCVKK